MMALILPNQQQGVEVNVTTHRGQLVIQFSRPIVELVLGTQDGAELAQAIALQVQEIMKGRSQ